MNMKHLFERGENNCEKCGYSYTTQKSTDPCSKCKGGTQIIKNPEGSFYKYAEQCQNKKCGHTVNLGMSLKLNMESVYTELKALNEDGKVKEPKGFCAICSN